MARRPRPRAGVAALAMLIAGTTGCARPSPRASEPPIVFDYTYVPPGAGTVFAVTGASQGTGTFTKLQGDDIEGPIEPVAVSQSATMACTEAVTSVDASGPTTLQVHCDRAESTEDGQTKSWATTHPVTLTRTADEIVVTPADLTANLQLRYRRIFGQTLFVPSWAVMLTGAAGHRYLQHQPVALELTSAGVFLGDTAVIVVTSATATLTSLSARQAHFDFRAQASHPYAIDFAGTLTVDRATGWLLDSNLRATVTADNPETGFRLDLVVDSQATRRPASPPPRP